MVLLTLSLKGGVAQNEASNQGASQNTNRHISVVTAINNSLEYLKNNQSSDGSWTTITNQIENTALVLSAFLRWGETKASPQYGATILKAYDWLLSVHPASGDERLAVAVALSDYYNLHKDNPTALRVEELLVITNPPARTLWMDILATTRIPNEKKRPAWCTTSQVFNERFASDTNRTPPTTRSEYLTAYVAGRAKLLSGGRMAADQYTLANQIILQTQNDDGSFPATSKDQRITATALVLLSFADFSHAAFRFRPQKTRGEVKPADQEVKITL